MRVVTDRRGVGGGRVERCDGPWRSSGDWWNDAPYASHAPRPWDCDEWDVVLSDGAAYRISQSRNDGVWFVEGLVD